MANPNPGGTPSNLRPGNPGNKGGGRIKGSFREKCRKVTEDNLPMLEKIIKGTAKRGPTGEILPSFADSRAAWADIAKMGYGEAKILIAEDMVDALAQVLADDVRIPEEAIGDIVAALTAKLKG